MPSWWRLRHRRADLLPWRLQATNAAVVVTPRYVVGLLAFLICVDMTQVLGVLCYQLFLGTYFPWHLYPLMLNRAVELLALLCSDGRVPSVYSAAQIFLSVLSMVICIQKQPCGKFNCVAALVLYGVLLTYQGNDAALDPLFENQDTNKEYNDVIIAVEQPDGEKYAIARVLKDIAVVSTEKGSDEGSSHSKDKKKSPPNEKTMCYSEPEDSACKYENTSTKKETSDFHSDGTAPNLACEISTNRSNVCRHVQKDDTQFEPKAQGLETQQCDLVTVCTQQQDEEEAASIMFSTSLIAEIVSLFEDVAHRDRAQVCEEHHEKQS